jgi:hypothetical protein
MLVNATVVSKWPAPNYVDPETRGLAAVIVMLILVLLVTVLLGIRIYTRIAISKGFGNDDVLIVLTASSTLDGTGTCGMCRRRCMSSTCR